MIKTIDDLISFLKTWYELGNRQIGHTHAAELKWLPGSLRKLHATFSNWIDDDRSGPFGTQDSMAPLSSLTHLDEQGYTTIVHENQGVWIACINENDNMDDPPVYVFGDNSESPMQKSRTFSY